MPETRKLPFLLSDHEILLRATDAAKITYEAQLAEVKLEVYVKTAKADLKLLEGNAAALLTQVRERQEYRQVEIDFFHDPGRACVDTIRLDTHEVIETRAMNADELADARQTKLPGLGGGRRGAARHRQELDEAAARFRDAIPDGMKVTAKFGDQPEHVIADKTKK